jgi:glycosyltransferase involved in cell wall biosynthesis
MALFRPRKGLETLIDALARLRDAGHEVRLRAVGKFETAEYEREIQNRVRQLNVGELIDWRGFQSDVAAEFAAMDLFVLPSLFGEGLPMVLLEAMSFGVPVVATRVEGVPEAIRDGLDGMIVAPGDPAALAEAVSRFIAGDVDWQALRTNARRRQVEHFSDRSMAATTAEVYRRVLAKAACPTRAVSIPT